MAKVSNTGKVVYLGFLFFIIFTIFNGLQNIITLLYTQLGYPNLGRFTLLSMFITGSISQLIGPSFADKYPYNYTFFVSCSPILLFLIVGKFASICSDPDTKQIMNCSQDILYPLHFVAASSFGFFGSILWAAQSAYVSECSDIQNKGKLFGLFWSFMACSQISANLLTTIILRLQGASSLFNLYITIALIGITLFIFIKKPESNKTKSINEVKDKTKVKQSLVEGLSEDLLTNNHSTAEQIDASVLSIHELPQEPNSKNTSLNELKPDISLISQEKTKVGPMRFIPFFSHPNIGPCIPLFMLQGYAFSTFITNLSVMIYDSLQTGTQAEKNAMVGIAFLAFGVTEVLAGQVFGYVFDKLRNYSITIYCLVNCLCIGCMYSAYCTGYYWLYILTACAFAFSDVGGQTIIGGTLATKFTEKVEPFVVFRFVSTVAAAVVMAIYLVYPDVNPFITVVGIFGSIVATTWYFRNEIQA